MKLSDIKSGKKDVMRDYSEGRKFRLSRTEPIEEKREPKEMSIFDKDKTETRKEKKQWREQSALDKETVKYEKNKLKLERLKVKADISEQKKKLRESGRFRGLGREIIAKAKEKPSSTDVRGHVSIEQSRLAQEKIRRDRELMRKGMEEEREYHRKFGVRNEGDGELPYYEKEEGRPLTPPCKVAPKIGITNGERIPKKKSLKDELL